MAIHSDIGSEAATRAAGFDARECERFVAKLDAGSNLAEDEKQTLRELCADTHVVKARHDIIREGDNSEHVHIVLNGWAARYKALPNGSRQIVAFVLPGDFCDLHVTILRKIDHGIVALTPARVAFVPRRQMEEVLLHRPTLARALWRATLVDEAVLRAWIVNLGRRNAAARIAHLICELHARLALAGLAEDGHFRLPLTQEVIADAVGLTSVHVNRVLQKLRASNLIVFGGGGMTILDPGGLRRLAGFDPQYLHHEHLLKS